MTSVMMLWRFQVLETCICIELVSVWVLDRACHFAQSMGCDKVNLEALPECILHQEKDILTLVLDMAHWDSCYSWEIWLDELKVGKSSLEAMEKGKLIPLTISSKCGLASRWTHSIFAYANNWCDWYSYGPAGAAIIEIHSWCFSGLPISICLVPLSFWTYTWYFLVPHIASCLIAEDKVYSRRGVDTPVTSGTRSWQVAQIGIKHDLSATSAGCEPTSAGRRPS